MQLLLGHTKPLPQRPYREKETSNLTVNARSSLNSCILSIIYGTACRAFELGCHCWRQAIVHLQQFVDASCDVPRHLVPGEAPLPVAPGGAGRVHAVPAIQAQVILPGDDGGPGGRGHGLCRASTGE